MLNRRIIRIKVFKVLYSIINSGEGTPQDAQKRLTAHCEGTRDLYCFTMNVLPALRKRAADLADKRMHKHFPTEEELHPNMRFINNRFILMLENNAKFSDYCSGKSLEWSWCEEENDRHYAFIKNMFDRIEDSAYYQDYMTSDEDSLEADCNFAVSILQNEFEDNDDFETVVDEFRIPLWTDDIGYVLNCAISDVTKYAKSSQFSLPRVFSSTADESFAKQLLSGSILNYKDYSDLIAANTANWDADRIVPTDISLIVMGITEAVSFPDIPVKVTINEYVDIAKYYSTPNSRIFVNGLLDKIIQQKINSGEIKKDKE
jgi:N utilization substance protein B